MLRSNSSISGFVALLAAVGIALGGVSGAARAQAPAPGFGASESSGAAGNIVGGGVATIVGGGDEMQIIYSGAGAGRGGILAQPNRTARLGNGLGGGPEVEYLEPPAASPGREAWVFTDGDGPQVVYGTPRAPAPGLAQQRR